MGLSSYVGHFRRESGTKTTGIILQQSEEIICGHLRWGQPLAIRSQGVHGVPSPKIRGCWGTRPFIAILALERSYQGLKAPRFGPFFRRLKPPAPSGIAELQL